MRKRRLITILLAAALATAAATGCAVGGGTKKAAQTEVTSATNPPASETTRKTEETARDTEDATYETEDTAQKPEESERGATNAESGDGNEEAPEKRYAKTPNPPAGEGDRILFVGNSHTYTNDLPNVFLGLAQAGGHKVEVQDITQGRYTLQLFSDPQDEMGALVTTALKEEPWDFVVLQENTNAALPGNVENDMLPPARKLDEMIKSAGAQTVFLMTWTPEAGAGAVPREVVQSLLSQSYQSVAEELDALLIPGGDVFIEALDADPELKLWGEDGQHPSVEGAYLAACAAYALLFQESPVGNTYYNGLEQEAAAKLQGIAESYMLEGF